MTMPPPPPPPGQQGGMPWDPSLGAPPPAPGQQGGWSPLPPLPPGPAPLPPPKKRKIWPVVAIVAVAAAALGVTVYFGLDRFGPTDDEPTVGSPAPSDSASDDGPGMAAVDLRNAPVYVRGELVAFTDGVYEDFTLRDTAPVLTDLDGDGDDDAAALVDVGGGATDPWAQILLWVWEGGEARPIAFEASWQWTCDPLVPMAIAAGDDATLSVTRSVDNKCGTESPTETIAVALADGFPVEVMGEHHSATTRCRDSQSGSSVSDVTGKADPLVLNADGAPVLAQPDEYTKIVVRHGEKPDTTVDNGYAIAQITWVDGLSLGCGWVPWSAIG